MMVRNQKKDPEKTRNGKKEGEAENTAEVRVRLLLHFAMFCLTLFSLTDPNTKRHRKRPDRQKMRQHVQTNRWSITITQNTLVMLTHMVVCLVFPSALLCTAALAHSLPTLSAAHTRLRTHPQRRHPLKAPHFPLPPPLPSVCSSSLLCPCLCLCL